ncbi:MAG: hypothetical protein ACJ780_23405 [Solirubrobacteraceae bacterium]
MLRILFGLLALGTAVGCGTNSQTTSSTTTCGVPYIFSVPGHPAIKSGSCAGLITSTSVTVRRGQRLFVEITHEENGRLDFPVPTPTTAAIKILSRSGASISYRAVSTGTTSLIAHHTQFCAALDPRRGSCRALTVHIEP